MWNYIARRLLLLPITLFFIVLVNFTILCLAPGDPLSMTDISQQGASRREGQGSANPTEKRYLQFREFYGLTLPILWNSWPFLNQEYVDNTLKTLSHPQNMSFKELDELKIRFGDQARFIMPLLLNAAESPSLSMNEKEWAQRFFIRGAFHLGFIGPQLTDKQKRENQKIAADTQMFASLPFDPQKLRAWYEDNKALYGYEPSTWKKIELFFFETRFFRYLTRVVTLDFGTLRNDPNKTVLSEVVKRFKYSLTLSITPLIITLGLSLLFGMMMAVYQNTLLDGATHITFLILFAIPIFVAAPFLIENLSFGHTFPFTHTPVPSSGFTSPDSLYQKMTSSERLLDILQHLALPLIALLYGSLATQARLSRTAFLENLNKDYVRAAVMRGVPRLKVLFRHVARNASITLVTSIAGSLGVILGGSLIIETLFEIDGFGRFFYDAILNRDYNVIMFSALAGSFLTLIGYLVGDLAYMFLDPRVRLD